MNKRQIGSLLIVAGFLGACASHQSYPAASPGYPEGDWVLRADGTPAAPAGVQRARASSPAPEAAFAPAR